MNPIKHFPRVDRRVLLSSLAMLPLLSASFRSTSVLAQAQRGASGSALVVAIAVATLALSPQISRADESGISFWVPGLFGSLAAVPQTPGWSLGTVYYHTSVAASGAAAAAREIQVGRFSPTVNVNLNVNLNAPRISCSCRRRILSQHRC
jgi:hypothetical protein